MSTQHSLLPYRPTSNFVAASQNFSATTCDALHAGTIALPRHIIHNVHKSQPP